MDSVSPVYDEDKVQYERVLALDQPEYQPIIVLPFNFYGYAEAYQPHVMAVRFRLSDEERTLIANGADIVIGELVYGRPFTPIKIQLCMPNELPEGVSK